MEILLLTNCSEAPLQVFGCVGVGGCLRVKSVIVDPLGEIPGANAAVFVAESSGLPDVDGLPATEALVRQALRLVLHHGDQGVVDTVTELDPGFRTIC